MIMFSQTIFKEYGHTDSKEYGHTNSKMYGHTNSKEQKIMLRVHIYICVVFYIYATLNNLSIVVNFIHSK